MVEEQVVTPFNNVYDAWHYIVWVQEFDIQDVTVVKVNPKTLAIDADTSLNRHINVWIEIGKTQRTGDNLVGVHYAKYDSGGDTFEEAVINCANKIYFDEDVE